MNCLLHLACVLHSSMSDRQTARHMQRDRQAGRQTNNQSARDCFCCCLTGFGLLSSALMMHKGFACLRVYLQFALAHLATVFLWRRHEIAKALCTTVASKRKGVSVDNIVHFKCITCNKWNIEQGKLYAVQNIAYF